MCGFCGFTRTTDNNKDTLNNMMNQIIHRGPDSEGSYIDEKVAFGFRRLSIIGIDERGSQPMFNEDRTIVLVFNGEIYNYMEIKQELILKGHTFTSDSDSEVLIHGYEEFGYELLQKVRGMFAFTIWDSNNERLFAARDFFGIKPYYYTLNQEGIVFGSEIKSILMHPSVEKELNEDALNNYLTFQYSPLQETFFKGIFKLPPAHYFVLEKGELNITRYWEPIFEEKDDSLTNYVNMIDNVVGDSIKAHKISDVEVGSFLSSGVDSSFVAARFNGDKTFTVGFDYDKYNEIDYAKKLSKKIGIDNYSKTITTQEYWDALPKVMYHMDEPLADPSAVALYFVSQLASQHVKVALSGEGADELFGGYNIYKEPLSLAPMKIIPFPIRQLMGKIANSLPFTFKGKSFLTRAGKSLEERFIGNAFMFTDKEKEKLLKNNRSDFNFRDITRPFYDKVKNKDDITKMQYLDIHLWMAGDILLKADKMSMAHSLEVRVPYLDKKVMELAGQIPTKYRVNKTDTKYAFRLAAKKYLPSDVAGKKKLGFPVPIRIWLKDEGYYNIVKEAFSGETAKKYFKRSYLIKLLNEHKLGKRDNSRKIWTVYIFLVWHREFFGL